MHRHAVSSYGNRLLCRWTKKGAQFHWGNSRTYREYFEDYRAFVTRPDSVVQEHSARRLAIVHVDIEKFYDCVKRSTLISKLRQLAESKGVIEPRDEFFTRLERIFTWRWHEHDREMVESHFRECADDGIPQGLVAGGFFANAYMLTFDRALRRKLDTAPTAHGWTLIDYCRYVDDMRLVIECEDFSSLSVLKEDIIKYLHRLLAKHAPGLRINADKTDVMPVIARPSVVQVAGTMESIQTQVSGPLDPTAANQVLATLNALFPIAEQAASKSQASPDGTDDLIQELQSAELDVRPDTVERFAANRWRRVYRSLRAMTDQTQDAVTPELKALDEKARLFSRTLIRRWVGDPSNVRLLRVAFDVMPDVDNLDRYVLKLLRPLCFQESADDRRYVAWYAISELLKAGATETGFVRDGDELPKSVDLNAYRQRLAGIAKECQRHSAHIPWYLHQQSALYLLIHGKQVKLSAACGVHYRVTMNCLRRKWKPKAETLRTELPAVLRSIDLGADGMSLRDQIVEAATELKPGQQRSILRLFDEHTYRAGATPKTASSVQLTPSHWITLDSLFAHPENPFAQENAALKLAEALLDHLRSDSEILDPRRLLVQCDDFGRLCDPTARTRLLIDERSPDDPLKLPTAPHWCKPENRWRLGLALVLSNALKQPEASGPTIQSKQELRYRPARIRRTGLHGLVATSRYQLGGPMTPVSPWVEEFLMHLGQWPGFVPFPDLVQLGRTFTRKDVLDVVRKRLTHQAKLYGRASDMPLYEVPIRFSSSRKGDEPFTVMLVQTALPKKEDFNTHGIDLSEKGYRRRHRRHLASVLRLILQTIDTRATHANARRIDLIVLPELAVHPGDIHLLRLLISKTRAWVFAGMVFETLRPSGRLGNRGVWLIPTFKHDGTRSTRTLLRFDQGKHHLTLDELGAGIMPCRDCQWVIVGRSPKSSAKKKSKKKKQPVESTWRLSAAVCYDATDLRLASDLRDVTDGFVVSALNQDVPTFDNMVAALHYHMYQHIVLVNSGEFGGSSVQAPYIKHYVKNRVHAHGSDQVVISICEMNLLDFRYGMVKKGDPDRKTPPAGFARDGLSV
jgi:hypothetical protein